MEDRFKKTEATLYNYRSLEVKIKNIQIDIDDLENDITVRAINYDEKPAPTNAFHSAVEDEVVRRDEHVKQQIEMLKAKLKYNQNLKAKVDGALEQLTTQEYKLVNLRYFQKDKRTWLFIGQELGFDKDYCVKIRNKIIKKLSELIYP